MRSISKSHFESKLDALHKRISAESDPATQALLTKYFCLQTSGYLETVFKHLLIELSTKSSPLSVQNLVQHYLKNLTNLKYSKILKMLEVMNKDWADKWKSHMDSKAKLSLDSVIANRNQIAHGNDVGLTFKQMEQYYLDVRDSVDLLCKIVKK